MAATYQVTPTEQFTFSRPQEWPKWIRRFERFRNATSLATKEETVQVNTLIYTMGDEADDIFRSFGLSEEEKKVYTTVLNKFESHFAKRRNIIFERAKFNMRIQGENEPVDAFITDLYSLAEHCGYTNLHDEMIRDRLVVGLQDASLSEKLQLDPDLTLDKAVYKVRQNEAVKKQQKVIRSAPHIASPSGRPCSWCGRTPSHDRSKCPAKDSTCRKCAKKGHFQAICRSSAKVRGVHQEEELHSEEEDETSLGAVFLEAVGETPGQSI